MDKKLQKEIVEFLKQKGATKIELFGSYARGEEKENSDIDLIVDFDNKYGLMSFVAIKLDLEEKLHREIDLLTKESISPYILPYIEKDKRVLFETKS